MTFAIDLYIQSQSRPFYKSKSINMEICLRNMHYLNILLFSILSLYCSPSANKSSSSSPANTSEHEHGSGHGKEHGGHEDKKDEKD